MALRMAGATEGAHMQHPDFRVAGKIFATLRADGETAMVVLTPDQQAEFTATHPQTFTPESGAWGRQGCTRISLPRADAEVVGEALTLAWQNATAAPPRRTRKTRS